MAHLTDEQWRSLSSSEIKTLTGASGGNVASYRRRHNKPEGPVRTRPSAFDHITDAQWRWLSATDIAAACGATYVAAAKFRVRNHKPKRLPKSKRDPQREAEIRWALHHPEQSASYKRQWEQSPRGKAWLKTNQAEKNARRKEWRAKRRAQNLPYT